MPGITHVLSSGLHVGVLSAIDPNVNNLVAAGTLFTTTKQASLLPFSLPLCSFSWEPILFDAPLLSSPLSHMRQRIT
jgi:hypothetical protein